MGELVDFANEPASYYSVIMEDSSPLPKGYQQLRWKLTLSYTAVTVGALLTVELILLIVLGVLLAILLNSGFLPAQLIESTSNSFSPTLRILLAQTPPDQAGISEVLDHMEAASSTTLPLSFDVTDEFFIVDADGILLGARSPDLLVPGLIGQSLDPQSIPGLAGPLQAALAGVSDTEQLYSVGRPGGEVVLTVPVWDTGRQNVLGALIAVTVVPTVGSFISDTLPIIGVSFLIFVLIAAVVGSLFGYFAARKPVQRLNQLSEASLAWRQGDFTFLVDDPSEDELGSLSRRLNEMALQLEQLLQTRRELAVVEERNRLARDLHDSVKQQAFAAAAQVSGVRALIKRDPEEADRHLEEAERLIYDLRQELTTLIMELRPAALDDQGLASAINNYAGNWSRQNEILSEVRIQGERPLDLAVEQPLFRITQEALANVARHSEASNVEIALNYASGSIELTVSDNGNGFDTSVNHNGYGLRSMQERATALDGELTIESSPGKGSTIICLVPLVQSTEPDIEDSHG